MEVGGALQGRSWHDARSWHDTSTQTAERAGGHRSYLGDRCGGGADGVGNAPCDERGRDREIELYVSRHSWRCWRTKRLLARRGYRFAVIDASENSPLRSWLTHFSGRKTLPYVFVDHRPVGGLGEIRSLERSGVLEHLVRGEL